MKPSKIKFHKFRQDDLATLSFVVEHTTQLLYNIEKTIYSKSLNNIHHAEKLLAIKVLAKGMYGKQGIIEIDIVENRVQMTRAWEDPPHSFETHFEVYDGIIK